MQTSATTYKHTNPAAFYGGGFCCDKVYVNGSLQRILIPGGYIEGGIYYFYITDHLGNNRLVLNSSGTLIQKNHYYPFGMTYSETPLAEQLKQPYKYNGKELDLDFGLNLYDYGARYMDPSLGRFTTVDPLAEKYSAHSPYCYTMNNPVMLVDPDGREVDWYENSKGEKIYDETISSAGDMKDKGIKGEYLGKTHKEGERYFSLFGEIKDLKTLEGKLHEKIDQSLINYAKLLKDDENAYWENAIEIKTDFDIGLPFKKSALGISEGNIYTFNYEGAKGLYFVRGDKSAMKGKFEWMKDNYNPNKNYGFGGMPAGYNSRVLSNKSDRLDVVTLVFPTLEAKQSLRTKFNQEFK